MAAVQTRDIGEETLDLLRRLIALQSVNDLTPDSGQEIKAANLFEDYFADLPVTCERIEAHPGRTTLVVTVPGTDPSCEALTLLGHTDVVPVDEKHWTHPPFEGEISDGQIWGRGSVDMLHLTAAMAVVTRRIAQEIADGGARPRATLTFVAAADEEARGGLGVPWIGEHRPEAFSWDASLSEMGGAHIRGARGRDSVVVIAGEKGAAQRRLHVRGDAGHGSIPLGRVSAVEMLGRVSRALAQAQWPHASDEIWAGFVRAFEFDAPLETSLLEGSYTGDYSEFGDLAAYAHAVSHMTVAQTVVRAGGPINVLPSSGYIELDIRTLPGQSDDDVDRAIFEALGELAPRVQIERLLSEPATASSIETKLYRTIEEVLREAHPGAVVVPILFPGGSDLRVGRRKGGVGYGFGSCASGATLGEVYSQLHAHDEHMPIEDVASTVRELERLVRLYIGASLYAQ